MNPLEIFFPPFDTIVCDPNLEKYFGHDAPEKVDIGNYGIIIEKYMPPNSALFLHDKNIVAIYQDGNVVFDKIKLKKLEIIFAEFLKGNIKEGE